VEKIAIIILHWKNSDDTLECLASVFKIEDSHFEVILVDNGSSDLPRIKENYPDLHYVENGENLGYAEGNNRGIAFALAKGFAFIFLLNNDTLVHKDILTAFREASRSRREAAVFGAKIYKYDEPTLLWYAGGEVDPVSMRCYHLGYAQSDLEKKWEEIKETGYACGCALFIKADAIRKVGVLEPKFFLIWEEIDWCFRMRKAGFSSLFVPQAKVWHKVSSSFEGGNHGPLWHYFYARNRLLFLKRHFPLTKRLCFYRDSLFKEVHHLFKNRAKACERAALRGVRDYFLRRYGKGSFRSTKVRKI
jgi:GT2 family glycosyltransferase